MSHTPGPWNSEDAGEWMAIEAVTANGQVRREICVVSVDENYDDDDDSSEQEDRDNARLIASAPDLLALARRVHAECGPQPRRGELQYCPGCDKWSPVYEDLPHKPNCLWLAAEAVLKKAGAL